MKKKNKLFALLLLPVIGMTVISGCSSAEKHQQVMKLLLIIMAMTII